LLQVYSMHKKYLVLIDVLEIFYPELPRIRKEISACYNFLLPVRPNGVERSRVIVFIFPGTTQPSSKQRCLRAVRNGQDG
jgi:hypothetical protein